MKINEIALNENVWTDAAKLAGKALPRIERLPGETMKDAINRVKSELGGVKSADNLVWLCEFHHRGHGGIHTAAAADYEAEKYVRGLIK